MTTITHPSRSNEHVDDPHGARKRTAAAVPNMLLLAALWIVYSLVRSVTDATQRVSVDNAARLLAFEESLGIDIEQAVQSLITWPHAFVAANAYYLVHFPVTLAALAVAFWRGRRTVFPVLRNALIGCTTAALVIHLLIPMAPPRMLPGFIDAGREFGPNPYSMAGSDSANQFAAMPSLHVAWAIFVAYAIWHLSRHQLVKGAAVAHPVVTALVVIVTGHHFVADVAIGCALAVTALAVAVSTRRRTPKGDSTQRSTTVALARHLIHHG